MGSEEYQLPVRKYFPVSYQVVKINDQEYYGVYLKGLYFFSCNRINLYLSFLTLKIKIKTTNTKIFQSSLKLVIYRTVGKIIKSLTVF